MKLDCVTHEDDLSQFGQTCDFGDDGRSAYFPSSQVSLKNEATTQDAFKDNVLNPLCSIFNDCFHIEPRFKINSFEPEYMLVYKNQSNDYLPFLAIEVKQWNAFTDLRGTGAKEQVLTGIRNGGKFPKVDFSTWYNGTNKKGGLENLGQYHLRMGIKQLSFYLNAMQVSPAYGILTTYCHTYFVIREGSTLKISRPMLYSENNILRYIAEFIQLAIKKIHERKPTRLTLNVSPLKDKNQQADGEDDKDERKRRSKRGREVPYENKKPRSNEGISKCRKEFHFGEYVLGGVIGEGRTGCILRLFDPVSGRSFVAKGVNEKYHKDVIKEDILRELQNEVRIYKKLKPLQGNVVPFFHGAVYLYGSMYTLIIDELDADRLDPDKLSVEEKKAVVAALDKIHSLGVLHGDIREDNILVGRHEKCPFFVDFGFSRECRSKKAFKEEKKELRRLLQMNLLP